MWPRKKKQETTHKTDNVYSLMNEELERMHQLMQSSLGNASKDNVNIFYRRIQDLQDKMVEALEKQPLHADTLKDIQDTLTDTILLGGPTDSNNNGGNDG